MADYKLYLFDTHDHVRRRVDLECRDDAHAIGLVAEHLWHNRAELWQGGRMVRRFEPEGEA